MNGIQMSMCLCVSVNIVCNAYADKQVNCNVYSYPYEPYEWHEAWNLEF